MRLTHKTLISLVAAYQRGRRRVYEKGLCYGYTTAYLNAYLLEKTDDFFKRLDVLEKYHDSPKKLEKDIRAVRAKLANASKDDLTEEEKILIDIPAFFESMLLQQSPIDFQEVFPAEGILKQDYRQHHALSAPKDMVEPLLQHRSFHAATLAETQAYFDQLADRLSIMPQRIGIQVSSDTHTFPLTFNKEKNAWAYFDINLLGKAYRENRPLLIPKALIAQFIHQGLSADGVMFMPFPSSGHSLFSVDFYTTKHHSRLHKTLKALEIKHGDDDYYQRVNSNQTSLLSLYVSRGDLEGVQTCIAKGCNPNLSNNTGLSPLYYAANRGYVDIAAKLIDVSADIDHQTHDGLTPLMQSISARAGKDIIKLFLDKKADLSIKANDGKTALMMAADKGRLETIELLTSSLGQERLNDTDNSGNNALILAIKSNHFECAIRLIDTGCEVNHINHKGMTALGYACMKGQGLLVKRLIEKGAKNQLTSSGTSAAIARENGFDRLATTIESYFSRHKLEPEPIPRHLIAHQKSLDRVSKALAEYVSKRKKERLFEQGASIITLGLFHFFKPSEAGKQYQVKLESAKKLRKILLGKRVSFSQAEREACLEGRLGAIFQEQMRPLLTVPILESGLASKEVIKPQASA